jgi:hypothetical protein
MATKTSKPELFLIKSKMKIPQTDNEKEPA